MKVKINKKAEIKNIEEAEVVEVGTSAEAKVTEEAPKGDPNVVALDKLTDRELMEEIYFAVLDVLKKIGTGSADQDKAPKEKGEKHSNKNKLSAGEKKEVKAKLLAGGPYTEAVLTSWKRRDLVMYASVLELSKAKAFGVGTPELIANILAGQKGKK